jgi:regulatory protein
MMDRLAQKGFSSPDIESTISSLEKSGLIDDKKLAPELLRAASERKMLGRTGIAVYMKKRGLDQGLIDEVLRDYDDESELMAAFALVEKKLRAMSGCSADQKKKRLWNALRRRGFSHHVIRKAVASAGESG